MRVMAWMNTPTLLRGTLALTALFATPAAAQTALPAPSPASSEVAAIDTAQPSWSDADIAALVRAVDMAKHEGLNPADYAAKQLATLGSASGPGRDAIASKIAMKLAHDYNEGAGTPDSNRWHFDRGDTDYRAWLAQALSKHRVDAALQDLLPQNADYAALRNALANCTKPVRCNTLKINMNRWRRLPRDLGKRYVWVNLPSYQVNLVEDGKIEQTHKAIIGKAGTKSPAFASTITGVTVNPWWNVPQSIASDGLAARVRANPKAEAAKGYVGVETADGGFRVRQKPGPDNSLGRIKIEMPNDYAIYLHDTPERGLFDKDKRAFSHGCIRIQDPQGLAEALLSPNYRPGVKEALASGDTRTIDVLPRLPVYIVYLTAEADPDAPDGVRVLNDVYGWDKGES